MRPSALKGLVRSNIIGRPSVLSYQPRFQTTLINPHVAAPGAIITDLPVSFEDISRAHYRIASGIVKTHCDLSQFLSEICECNIYLKKDFTQFTGSFKERGGRNSLMLLSDEAKAKGVITASAGNHALALAWHGKDLGIPVTCVMPSTAPLAKVDKCRKFGANVILHGAHIGEAKVFYNITSYTSFFSQ